MIIDERGKVPIKSWCNSPEEGAVDQARDLASLPFIFKHVALMPDTHQGYGMPIGGVIATKGVIIPNAVGVDIGCGMLAVKTSLTEISTDQIKEIMGKIRKTIPVGFNHQKEPQKWKEFLNPVLVDIVYREISAATRQLGTLGGGNHFIEIQKGDDGHIWFMIHSGSRNFGYKIAKHYNEVAQKLCRQWYSNIPPIKGQDGLAFLPLDTQEGQDYKAAMEFALSFAKENRLKMAVKVYGAFYETLAMEIEQQINIHHNYARLENHFGQNVMVHRKGATLATKDTIGIIPGSQGTSSYIVQGKGNRESFNSCSHGAGRRMSRSKARKTLSLKDEQKKLNDQGIIHSIRSEKELDEASSAYKDIDVVMEEQKDLVDILVKLTPLAVIKG